MGMPFDLLLGRKTYDIFASYWPHRDSEDPTAAVLNKAVKYVVTHNPVENPWKKTVRIAMNVSNEIRKLKESGGPMLQVHGSSELIQILMENDLVDEIWLKIFPVILGKGKRLFDRGAMPMAFNLIRSSVTPSEVIIANYERAGEVETGTFT